MNEEELYEWIEKVHKAVERFTNKITSMAEEVRQAFEDAGLLDSGDDDGRNKTD